MHPRKATVDIKTLADPRGHDDVVMPLATGVARHSDTDVAPLENQILVHLTLWRSVSTARFAIFTICSIDIAGAPGEAMIEVDDNWRRAANVVAAFSGLAECHLFGNA